MVTSSYLTESVGEGERARERQRRRERETDRPASKQAVTELDLDQ